MLNFRDVSASLHTVLFDFDGVFTDNKVITDSDGRESVTTSREDSFGIKLLREEYLKNGKDISLLVLSTEASPVVAARCNKLGIDFAQNLEKKEDYLQRKYQKHRNASGPDFWRGFLFLGNDLNDLGLFEFLPFTACPSDSHPRILGKSGFVSQKRGGNGFIRDVLERVIQSNNPEGM
jgi:3-deoxy-D-manno-octulosonate 8-phosphate phosphatase (KDO 8-P phosphatase)